MQIKPLAIRLWQVYRFFNTKAEVFALALKNQITDTFVLKTPILSNNLHQLLGLR